MKKEELLNDEFIDDEIESFLDNYVIEKVSEEEINETIDVLRAYVPRKKESTLMKKIFKLLRNEVGFITPVYWIIGAIALVVGVGAAFNKDISPYMTMWAMAPVPVLLGLLEILRKNNEKVIELEMSFKYSFREIILCRLFIIGVLSIVFNITLSLFIKSYFTAVTWASVLSAWVIPYTTITAISLVVATRIRNESVIIAITALWLGFSILSAGRINVWIENLKVIQSLIMSIGGAAFMSISYSYFYKKKIQLIQDGVELN